MARIARSALAVVFLMAVATACTSAGGTEPPGAVVRLGYFPNITHATALVGVKQGIFAKALGSKARLEPKIFNAGPEAVTALFADAVDATYIGPNPTINAYAKSHGEAVRIIAGATSGGAFLVVRDSITKAADLRGRTIASPQLGNTQDVALRSWLKSQNLATDVEGGGDVEVVPQDNAQSLETFTAGTIDGAWVPEPWASRLVLEGKGHVLVDEADLWPGGRYVTTQLVVRTAFLKEHPDLVAALLRGHVAATDAVNADAALAQQTVATAIEEISGKKLSASVVARSWKSLTFTVDPIASSLRTSAANATLLELLEPVDLAGIYDLAPLNAVLTSLGKEEVRA
jgi:NitT/TauT family transport system substrate-binding protein